MAFKPMNQNNSSTEYEPRNYPVPKAGSRKARVSMIIDLGVQEREDLWELDGKVVAEGTDGATCKPQKPCQQVAVFADLVADTVDYGGELGKQHYRMLLNNTFAGKFKGINFVATPPKDAKGNIIVGKKWGFHPANLLTKLAKAVGKPEVIESMDVDELLGLAFMAQVVVTEKDSGKKDNDGEPIIYRNVNFKGSTEVPEIEDEDTGESKPMPVAKLAVAPMSITFENAEVADIKFIRVNILKQIKLAQNYAGSKMQKAIEAFEASKNNHSSEDDSDESVAEEDKPKAAPVKPVKKAKAPEPEDDTSDAPF